MEFPMYFSLTDPLLEHSHTRQISFGSSVILYILSGTVLPLSYWISGIVDSPILMFASPFLTIAIGHYILRKTGRTTKDTMLNRQLNIERNQHFLLTEKGVEYFNPDSYNTEVSPKKFRVRWEEISSFECNAYNVEIRLTSGNFYQISLSNLGYNQHQELKKIVADVQKFITA